MSTSTVTRRNGRPLVLGDAIPGARIRDVALVIMGALLTVLAARISIHIPPSPVPVTGQTLAVVVAGAALGARRGAASQILYVLLGLFLPVYADGAQGWHVILGATGGYLVAFPIAAFAIGALAERGADRRPLLAILAFAAGQLIIFGIGVPWLKFATGLAWAAAIYYGFVVFILGGVIKAILAGLATPAAWRFVRRAEASRD
jgi:biotin transport system substrate-specific component